MESHLKSIHNSTLLAMRDAGMISQSDLKEVTQLLSDAINKNKATTQTQETEELFDNNGVL